MTLLQESQEQQRQQPNWSALTTEQKSRMLCSHVEGDQGAHIYFSVHTKIRSIIYVQKYLAGHLNRTEILNIIKESYFPMLVKSFAKWERSNGKRLSRSDVDTLFLMNPAVRQTTSELLMYWLEEEARSLWQSNRESKFKRLSYGY